MLKKIFFTAFILFSSTWVAAQTPLATNDASNHEIAANVVSIKTPEVNATMPTQHGAQVYMELDNKGAIAHQLIAAYSPVAKLIQLHQTFQKEGTSFMQQVPVINIKPSQEQDLKQGGFHVMLMGLNQSLKKGHKIPLVLLFEDGSYLNLNITII
ncbi:MAG TPA: copper chaperone PCu(A)C [Gammaproteobacteria bacterium]|nr:copper chaperone PCu(A)C [Gammaproteobacteria bacterium]